MSYALKFLKTKAITISKLSRTAFIVERSVKQNVLVNLSGNDAMADFINKRKLIEKETLENTTNTIRNLDVNTSKDDLVKISYILYSDTELNTMLDAFKKIYQNDTKSWHLIGENLVRTLINLENTNRLLDLFRRNEYRFMFLNTRCYDILFNKLYDEKRYQDVVNLFEESVSFYRRSARSTGSRIPSRHLEMVTSSLVKLNSDKALEKAKQILKRVELKQSKLSNLSVVQLCTLAFNQGDYGFAEQEILRDLAKQTSSIVLNLKAITQSNNDISKAVGTVESIVKNNENPDRFLLASLLDRLEKLVQEGPTEQREKLQERLSASRQKAIEGNYLVTEKLNQICLSPELSAKYIQPPTDAVPRNSYEINSIKMVDNTSPEAENKKSSNGTQKQKQTRSASSPPSSSSSSTSAAEIVEPWSRLNAHLNSLLQANQLPLVVDTYLLNLQTRLEKSGAKNGKFSDVEKQKETENLNLVTKSILAWNTKSCLKRLNKLINLANSAELELGFDSKVHIFLLNIRQNEPSSAFGFLNMFGIEKTSPPLYRNLKAICHSKLNDLGQALDLLDEVRSKKKNKFTNEGFVFPFTVESVQRRLENEPADSKWKKKFDEILKSLKAEDRILKEDIFDMFDVARTNAASTSSPTSKAPVEQKREAPARSKSGDASKKQPKEAQMNKSQTKPKQRADTTVSKLKSEIAETRKKILGNPAPAGSSTQLKEESMLRVFDDLDKAFVNQRYDKFIHEFHIRLAYNSKKSIFDRKLVASYLPYLAKSFLLAKDVDLERMKTILALLKAQGYSLDPVSMVNVFLAVILHKDPMFALETLVDLDKDQVFKKTNPSVHDNLLVVGFVMINQISLAFDKVDAILKCQPNTSDKPGSKFDGILFPFTLNCLKELANYAKDGDQEALKRVDEIEEKCMRENRLSSVDLSELSEL